MMVDIIKSSKSDILQIYDNLTIYPEDGKHFEFDLKKDHPSESKEIFMEKLVFHSSISKVKTSENKPYNFALDVEFDEQKNHIRFIVPDDGPNGSSPKFEAEAEVFQKQIGEDGEEVMYKSDDLIVSGYVKNASITLDLGFMGHLSQNQLDSMKKLGLEEKIGEKQRLF